MQIKLRGEQVQALLSRHADALLCYAVDLGGRVDQATQVVRDVLLSLCDRAIPSHAPWSLTALLTDCRKRLIDTSATPAVEDAFELPAKDRPSCVDGATPAAGIVPQRFGQLPRATREVLRLHFAFGLSNAQIAEVTGRPLDDVEAGLHRVVAEICAEERDESSDGRRAPSMKEFEIAAAAVCQDLDAEQYDQLKNECTPNAALAEAMSRVRVLHGELGDAFSGSCGLTMPDEVRHAIERGCRDTDIEHMLLLRQLVAEQSNPLISGTRCLALFLLLAWPWLVATSLTLRLSHPFARMYDQMLPGEPLPGLTLLVLNLAGAARHWAWFVVLLIPGLWVGRVLLHYRSSAREGGVRPATLFAGSIVGRAGMGNLLLIVGTTLLFAVAMVLPLVRATTCLGNTSRGNSLRPHDLVGLALAVGLVLGCAGVVLIITEVTTIERETARRRALSRAYETLANEAGDPGPPKNSSSACTDHPRRSHAPEAGR